MKDCFDDEFLDFIKINEFGFFIHIEQRKLIYCIYKNKDWIYYLIINSWFMKKEIKEKEMKNLMINNDVYYNKKRYNVIKRI